MEMWDGQCTIIVSTIPITVTKYQLEKKSIERIKHKPTGIYSYDGNVEF